MKIQLTPSGLKALAAAPEAYEHKFLWQEQGEPRYTRSIDDWAFLYETSDEFATVALMAVELSALGELDFAEGFRAEATRQGWYDPENEKSEYPLCHIHRWWPCQNFFRFSGETPYETGVKIAGFGWEFSSRILMMAAHLPLKNSEKGGHDAC